MLPIIIGLLLSIIFFVLSMIHFYWGMGDKSGLSISIPTNEHEQKVMNPKPLDCFVVAIGLLSFGVFVLIKVNLISFALPSIIANYGLPIIIGIFLLRAIGEFKYVGFFKKLKGTPFAQMDTRYYSPLCLLISIMGLILVLTT